MADIISFRQAKKRRAAADIERQAAANRAKHGRTAEDKAQAAAESDKLRRSLDSAKRDDGKD